MNDSRAWHFVALDDGRVLGCVLLVPLEEIGNRAQLIQMAVETEWQRKGIGDLLVRYLLEFARNNGIREILIHARDNTTDFYGKFGFEVYGETFEEVGVLHRHMRMFLSQY